MNNFHSLLYAERQGFFVRFATKAFRDYEPRGSHPAFITTIGRKSTTYGLLSAERQVLETIIKYIIIMMLYFVLYILIYSILSSI